jgi:hypothetical protein
MLEPELAVGESIRKAFPDATTSGPACWSFIYQNGRAHSSRGWLEGNTFVLTSTQLSLGDSPQRVLAKNVTLPAATRIVLTRDGGLELRTEVVLWPDAEISVCEGTLDEFRIALDILGCKATSAAEIPPRSVSFEQEPAPNWSARKNEDGTWTISLPHEKAALHASPILVVAKLLDQRESPEEVRAAVAEFLLRSTSEIRFAKACARSDADADWAAWIQASPATCGGMDEALTATTFAYRECAAEVRALSEVRLARRYQEVASIWRAQVASIPREKEVKKNV